ncbi:MAG: PAS domain S-box protein [candidate division Zixibacteria bacterium]|nr:PAS domain S-box protein [candidate division Zixibacteria bacterium]
MLGFKTPGLFIRISHLIIIQVLFIFAALALVLFDSGSSDTPTQHYYRQRQQAEVASQTLFDLIEADSTASPFNNSKMKSEAERLVRENSWVDAVNVIYHNPRTGRDSLFHLSDRTGFDSHPLEFSTAPDSSLRNGFIYAGAGSPTVLSGDGSHLGFIMRPTNARNDYAIYLTASNDMEGDAKGNQAEVLFLLFLFSALISLLIINLMFRGVKRPLANLIEALERTADGHEHYVSEDEGDKDIQRLARAFNQMSQSLSEKQRKLSIANHELVKANKSLIESESILTALVDYSPDAIIVTDLDDQVIIYNQQAARGFGYNQSDLLGRKIGNLFALPNTHDRLNATETENLETQEIICRRRDGSRFPALLVHTTLGPEGCKPIAMLYFIKDISESENYQNMILRLDRIASRGKMARDIAHEINNYLAILQGNLELLPMFMAKNDTAKCEQKINVMKDTVTKISKFTDGLTQFSDENSEFRKEDLNQLIENLIAFVKPQNKFDDILIGTNLSENLPLVEIDASQIQLLLVNLLYNAAEAMTTFEGTRWIIISTAPDESGQNVILKVTDSGPGINEENIPKMFVTRFSTKRGCNGLGLITCKNVADIHKGEIAYHTGDESRAIFVINLPVKREIASGQERRAGETQKVPSDASK